VIQHRQEIGDREPDKQQRQGGAQLRSLVHEEDDQAGQREPGGLSAGIAHEDRCRVGIEADNSEGAAEGRGRDREHDEGLERMGNESGGRQVRKPFSPGKPVETVRVVQGVEGSDHREGGEGDGEPVRQWTVDERK